MDQLGPYPIVDYKRCYDNDLNQTTLLTHVSRQIVPVSRNGTKFAE